MTDGRDKRRLSPEEYRRVLLRERRRVMRTVRNTLLGIAILAGLWFIRLLVRDRALRRAVPAPTPPATVILSDSDSAGTSPSDSVVTEAVPSAGVFEADLSDDPSAAVPESEE